MLVNIGQIEDGTPINRVQSWHVPQFQFEGEG